MSLRHDDVLSQLEQRVRELIEEVRSLRRELDRRRVRERKARAEAHRLLGKLAEARRKQ